jgi:hypothetical protein
MVEGGGFIFTPIIKIDDKYFIHYLENALKKPPPFAFSGTGTEA